MFPVALAIGAGISALSSIAGGVSANKRRKKADQILEDRRRRLDEWYQSEMNQPYLDRADSRAMLKRIRDYNEDELKALNTNAIKSGATDEAKVAAAGKAQQELFAGRRPNRRIGRTAQRPDTTTISSPPRQPRQCPLRSRIGQNQRYAKTWSAA